MVDETLQQDIGGIYLFNFLPNRSIFSFPLPNTRDKVSSVPSNLFLTESGGCHAIRILPLRQSCTIMHRFPNASTRISVVPIILHHSHLPPWVAQLLHANHRTRRGAPLVAAGSNTCSAIGNQPPPPRTRPCKHLDRCLEGCCSLQEKGPPPPRLEPAAMANRGTLPWAPAALPLLPQTAPNDDTVGRWSLESASADGNTGRWTLGVCLERRKLVNTGGNIHGATMAMLKLWCQTKNPDRQVFLEDIPSGT
jgi:hypothetical protein